MTRKYRYFIFDLDGTLAYTIDDLRAAMNRMLRHFGWREVSAEETLQSINNGARAFVAGCMPPEYRGDGEAVDRAYAKYLECYAEGYLNTTRLYPVIPQGIAYLKEQGAKLAVFSNKQDIQTKQICEKLFPDHPFELVMGHDGRFPHKPSPEGALHIVSVFGASPDETVLIGDSDVDMRLAANAGLHPVGVAWGYRPVALLEQLGAERILRDLDDFKALI